MNYAVLKAGMKITIDGTYRVSGDLHVTVERDTPGFYYTYKSNKHYLAQLALFDGELVGVSEGQ